MNTGFDAVLFESMEGGSFDPIDWVNRLLEANGTTDDEVVLNAVRSASARLQTRSQELSRDAERLMERMLSVGPRALQELDRVERDALTLKQDLKRLQEEGKTSTSNPSSFQTLKNLDTIKTNLERCVKVLQETGNWNVLVREMESLFASRNLGEVASRLSEMRESLETLATFPGSSERADMMERMEQRLESLLRPGLQNAFEHAVRGEFDSLKQSVLVFNKLGRRDALLSDLAQNRGKICYDSCWTTTEDGQRTYARFLDRVLAHLRGVSLPLCKYAFDTPEAVGEALAWIVKGCFDLVTSEAILELVTLNKTAMKTLESCERFVLADVSAERFLVDVSSSVLNSSPPEIKKKALDSVMKPFLNLISNYLEWESEALISSLVQHNNGQKKTDDDFLGPSGSELMLIKLKAEDILESLSESCTDRCSRLKLNSTVPIARMCEAHAKACFSIIPSQDQEPADEANQLKVIVSLKARFQSIITKCREENEKESTIKQVNATFKAFEDLIITSRSRLFRALMSPYVAILDKVIASAENPSMNTGPSAMTKALDHLYSLIPLLEFENVTPDLLAESQTLGKQERDELDSILGGPIVYKVNVPLNLSEIEEDDLARLVSASWVGAVARAMGTCFVLRILRLKTIGDKMAAQLGVDADYLEKNAGSVLAQGELWDPALGLCRVILCANPGLTNLTLGNPFENLLDDRYCHDDSSNEALKTLERMMVSLRTRPV